MKTSDTDKQIAADREMWERQKEFELQKWEMEKEYYDPAAQKRRYQNAGLNAALMAGAGQIGSGASMGVGSPSQNQNSLPLSSPTDYIGQFNSAVSNASDALQQSYQNEFIEAQTHGQQLDNSWKSIEKSANAKKAIADAEKAGADTRVQKNAARLQDAIFDSEVEYYQQQNANMAADTALKNIQSKLAEADLDMKPEQKQLLIANIGNILTDTNKKASEMNLINKQGELFDAESAHEYVKILLTNAQKYGIELDNKRLEKILPYVEDKEEKDLLVPTGKFGIPGVGEDIHYQHYSDYRKRNVSNHVNNYRTQHPQSNATSRW